MKLLFSIILPTFHQALGSSDAQSEAIESEVLPLCYKSQRLKEVGN